MRNSIISASCFTGGRFPFFLSDHVASGRWFVDANGSPVTLALPREHGYLEAKLWRYGASHMQSLECLGAVGSYIILQHGNGFRYQKKETIHGTEWVFYLLAGVVGSLDRLDLWRWMERYCRCQSQ